MKINPLTGFHRSIFLRIFAIQYCQEQILFFTVKGGINQGIDIQKKSCAFSIKFDQNQNHRAYTIMSNWQCLFSRLLRTVELGKIIFSPISLKGKTHKLSFTGIAEDIFTTYSMVRLSLPDKSILRSLYSISYLILYRKFYSKCFMNENFSKW